MSKKEAIKIAILISTIFISVAVATYFVSFFLRGYQLNVSKKNITFSPAGLLVANSDPKGASVFVNEKLITATDDTLNLPPEKHKVKLEKDGFLPWEKELIIRKEVVIQTNAILFKKAPDLKPLTTTDVVNPTLSNDKLKIAYGVEKSETTAKNGLWVLDLGINLPLNRPTTRQITNLNFNWQQSQIYWSPDNRQIMIVSNPTKAVVLSADRFTPASQVLDASDRYHLILKEWQQEQSQSLAAKIKSLPEELQKIASSSADFVTFSPDEEKFFYLATADDRLKENLLPYPPARSTQPETREIKKGNVYVYNLKEDTNFLLGAGDNLGVTKPMPTPTPKKRKAIDSYFSNAPNFYSLSWLTSNHLIYIDKTKKEIKVIEADATNNQTVYAGPFKENFVVPSPSEKSLIVLTSLHPDSPETFYEVKIR